MKISFNLPEMEVVEGHYLGVGMWLNTLDRKLVMCTMFTRFFKGFL